MAFKFPWSKKKEAPKAAAPAAEPAKEDPVRKAPAPAPVAEPAPVVDAALSDSIRDALENTADRFINTPSTDANQEEKVSFGMRLQDLKRAVDDAPCTYPGYDEIIVSAIQQLSSIAKSSSSEQLDAHLEKLTAAINARSNTVENTPKFTPTMQTHYYSVMLIELQGRLNALLEGKRRKEEFIQRTKAMPANERFGYRETIQAFTMELEDTELALLNLYKHIALCRGGLEEAESAMLDSGELTMLDPTEVLSGIYKRSKRFRSEYEAQEKAANKWQIMHQTEVEEQLIAVNRFAAANAEAGRIAAETEELSDVVRTQMDILTGRATRAEAASAVQETAPQETQEVVEEPVVPVPQEAPAMPVMPDVFKDDFPAMTM